MQNFLRNESFDTLSGEKAYDAIYKLQIAEHQLQSNRFPRPGAIHGTVKLFNLKPVLPHRVNERYCRRCSKLFDLSMYDAVAVNQCFYHPKSAAFRRGVADHMLCCLKRPGTPGCTYADYHVYEELDVKYLKGFVTTMDREGYVYTKKDVYAVDCEMSFTVGGMELTRVTVVDINGQTAFDALVKPENKMIDYNTTFSGVTEKMMANETRTLRDIQGILLSMFHSKTVLIGHSLDSDLKALKLIHDVVVDTSLLFPHKMGPPKKRALKTLALENLHRVIQENRAGHDSAEDAKVCIELVKHYLRHGSSSGSMW